MRVLFRSRRRRSLGSDISTAYASLQSLQLSVTDVSATLTAGGQTLLRAQQRGGRVGTATRTVVVTGAASGMGAATRTRLEAAGQRVIGVDLHDAEVEADLGTEEGRSAAVAAGTALADGQLEGLVTWAGVAGRSPRPGGPRGSEGGRGRETSVNAGGDW